LGYVKYFASLCLFYPDFYCLCFSFIQRGLRAQFLPADLCLSSPEFSPVVSTALAQYARKVASRHSRRYGWIAYNASRNPSGRCPDITTTAAPTIRVPTSSQIKRLARKAKFEKIANELDALAWRRRRGEDSFQIAPRAVDDRELSSRLCGPQFRSTQWKRE
jgi:hypothetical protein